VTPALWLLAAELLAVLVVAAGLFIAGHHGGVKAGSAAVQQRWDAERAARATADASKAAAELDKYRRRVESSQEIAHEAETAASAARADAAAAGAAADRLRRHAAGLAARCDGRADPAATAGSAPAAGPGLVLADLLARSDDTSGELAAAYDRARIAGLACERAYDSLTSTR
jgi:hypothetical protein